MIINIQAQYKLKNSIVRANLDYLAPPGHFFLGAKFFITTPYMQSKVLKMNLSWQFENAWQPIMRFMNGDVPTKLLISQLLLVLEF